MLIDLLLIPFGASYSEMRSAAVTAEEAGFNGLWTFDHFREPIAEGGGPVPECWTVLSALAEATTRLQLGPLVLNVMNRKPGLLANMAATLQEISGGRLLLGLGAGAGAGLPYTTEQEALGEPVPGNRERAERVAEAAQVLHALWNETAPVFEGKHYQLRRATGFLRPTISPPIIIGGFGPRMAAIAGRHGDGFNAPAGLPNLPELVERARAERLAAGKDPETFEISAFTAFSRWWLDQGGSGHARLDRLGVRRLILQVEPPYPLDEIRRAGAQLQPR